MAEYALPEAARVFENTPGPCDEMLWENGLSRPCLGTTFTAWNEDPTQGICVQCGHCCAHDRAEHGALPKQGD